MGVLHDNDNNNNIDQYHTTIANGSGANEYLMDTINSSHKMLNVDNSTGNGNFHNHQHQHQSKATGSQGGGGGWTIYLLLCCLTVSLASFQFGYNIASLNPPTVLLKEFIRNDFFLFAEFHEKKAWFLGNETLLNNHSITVDEKKSAFMDCVITFDYECQQNITDEGAQKLQAANERLQTNFTTMDALLADRKAKLEEKRPLLEAGALKVDKVTDILWTLVHGLFVLGGMIGSFASKLVLDMLGRKKGILFNALFSLVGAVLVFVAPYAHSPVCLMVSRLLFGIQGGMCCSLVPIYLSEIAPASLRGIIGAVPQLFITLGILVAQVLGFNELLGNDYYWQVLLAFPFVPALSSAVCFLLFFPESPKALLLNGFEHAAKRSLGLLRRSTDVNFEFEELRNEIRSSSHGKALDDDSADNMSMWKLLCKREVRWPLITSLVLQCAQQLCGINAIFFYSESIFKGAMIEEENIQYCIVATGLVNLLATIGCMPLIDRLGRKPLVVFPMALMVVDFVLLTVCLSFRDNPIFAYLSIVCIVVFIMCFAVGLGPIPFIYTAECFKQNERGSAMAICIFANWFSSLVLTLGFPFVQKLLHEYVFLVFLVVVLLSMILLVFKMPETKGKSCDEIRATFNGYRSSDLFTIGLIKQEQTQPLKC